MGVLIDSSILIEHERGRLDLASHIASCLAHGLSLITANVREFDRVPGLRWENWLV